MEEKENEFYANAVNVVSSLDNTKPRDFIGKDRDSQDEILKVYGKYAGKISLTKALLAEKSLERLRENK
jgi:hypothetical protein